MCKSPKRPPHGCDKHVVDQSGYQIVCSQYTAHFQCLNDPDVQKIFIFERAKFAGTQLLSSHDLFRKTWVDLTGFGIIPENEKQKHKVL